MGWFFNAEAVRARALCGLSLWLLAVRSLSLLDPLYPRRGLAAVTLILVTVLAVPPVAGQAAETIPKIESVAFTDGLGSYKLGDIIEVTVTFSEVVAVTGTPQIDLTIGSMTRQADYQSGPPSTDLVFHYTVADTDEAPRPDGATIPANALKLNGGSIKKHNTDIDAALAHEAHRDPVYYKAVDGITPVLWTAAVHDTHLVLTYSDTLWLYSRPPASDYAVRVNSAARAVHAVSISDHTVTLTLASAVTATDQVTVSYTVGTRPIQDEAGNTVAALSDQAVTTSAPYVSNLEISSVPAARQTYAGGDVIELTVTFSESVTVTGTPQLLLTFDSSGSYEQAAPYVSGSGTAILVFKYTVAEGVDRFTAFILRILGYNAPMIGDEAPDGLSIEADALQMHDGTIRDSDNHDATLLLDALTDAGNHKVDGLWPELVLPDEDPLVVNGATLTLRYDEMLDANSVPAVDAFAVTVGSVTNEVTGVSIDESTVMLTLLTPVGASDAVLLSYTPPDGTEATPVQDLVGNKARDITDREVRNDTSSPPPPPPPSRPDGTGGSPGGGGGGSRPQDRHGNTPARASEIPLGTPNWTAAITGQINPADDVDYFTLTLPHDGVLVVETTGGTDTVGTVWQAGEVLATSDSGGARQNFRLSVRVEARAVVIAVAGNGRRTGSYTLETTLLVGHLENPGPESFQSGIGLLSGWVCEADVVELEINGTQRLAVAYGTERADTEESCGDRNSGFGLLFNWNLLGDGVHTVVALADGVEFAQATFTVTTLGEELVTAAESETVVEDFPSPDERVRLVWQQANQNFVLAPPGGDPPPASPPSPVGGPVGALENPGPASFQSGIGLLSGWVCDAEVVELEIAGTNSTYRLEAAYGTERADTEDACDDTDNGFGLVFNWNLLGDGVHAVRALADGDEFGRATFTVTTLGVEFLQGARGETVVADFPSPGEEVRLIWQQANQNFVFLR